MATPSLLLIPNRYKSGVLYSQLPESGAGDFSVVRATTATRVNASGLLESVASGVPRLDFGVSGCPVLLVEASGTNLTSWSEDFTNADYILNEITVTANFAAAPNGEMTADKLVESVANSTHEFNKATSLGGSVDNSTYAISFYLKANGRSRVRIFDNNQNASGASIFDLSTGTVISGTGTISLAQNGFYICTIYPVKNFSTNSSVFFILINTGTNTTYTGDGVSGVIIWGMTVMTALSSYIKTEGASATRNADVMTVEPPVGTTLITTTFEDDTTQEIVPSGTFTIPNGRIRSIVMT
jgi:hypothetical protein